ncbi:hypothetical protein Tco_0490231 [Tanacetum coccineum]
MTFSNGWFLDSLILTTSSISRVSSSALFSKFFFSVVLIAYSFASKSSSPRGDVLRGVEKFKSNVTLSDSSIFLNAGEVTNCQDKCTTAREVTTARGSYTASGSYNVKAAEGVNVLVEEVSTAELVRIRSIKVLKWDQQVVSELVALRNFARRYGSRFCTQGGCIQSSHEFELWRMRIKQYIQMIDYALWEVIENGATLPKTQMVEGVMKVMPAEEKFYEKIRSEG